MIIGVPKEIKAQEHRVGLVPSSVKEFAAHGHTVLVESGAGAGINFSDSDYKACGAEICSGAAEIFKRADMIEAGWAIVQPILDAWAEGRGGPVHPYPAGCDGPEAADALIQGDGRAWRPL